MQTPRQQARGGSASLCFSWLQTGAPDFPLQIWSPSGLLTSPLFPATSQALACLALCYPPVCLSFPTQVGGSAIVSSGQATVTVCPASLHSLFISYSFPVATGSQKGRPFPSQLALLPPGRGGQLQAEEGSAGPGPSPVLSRGSELGSWGPTAQPEAKARSFSVSSAEEDAGQTSTAV